MKRADTSFGRANNCQQRELIVVDAVAVFQDMPASDEGSIQFDERRAISANKSSAAWLRVAASDTHIYVTGNGPPGPWYRLKRGKRGLYRIPRAAVESVQVLSNRNFSTIPLLWLILYEDFRDRRPLGLVDALVAGGFILAAIASLYFTRRFGLRIYTSDGFFYSVTESGFGRAKVREGLEWASRVRSELKSANWPVASS